MNTNEINKMAKGHIIIISKRNQLKNITYYGKKNNKKT